MVCCATKKPSLGPESSCCPAREYIQGKHVKKDWSTRGGMSSAEECPGELSRLPLKEFLMSHQRSVGAERELIYSKKNTECWLGLNVLMYLFSYFRLSKFSASI